MKLVRGDRVRVLTGKDRGKEGEVTRVLPGSGKVFVDGVHIAKRHTKPRRATMQGGIIDKHLAIDASNVAILCNNCGPTRISSRFDPDGLKVRVCAKCGGDL
jgi:large subunit ribosomal protein L24